MLVSTLVLLPTAELACRAAERRPSEVNQIPAFSKLDNRLVSLPMKKVVSKSQRSEDSDMLPEYDFRGGVRGKHYKAYRRGHTVKIHKADGTLSIHYFKPEEGAVTLEPDVQEYFPDEISGGGTGLHWDEIDEDISVEYLLLGIAD